MLRVVLDTNVWVSALVFGGSLQEIIEQAADRRIVAITSAALLDEFERVVTEKFPLLSEIDVQQLMRTVRRFSTLAEVQRRVRKIVTDPTDNRVLECAVAGRADVIVSGDKRHVLPLKSFRGIRIISPSDFLKEIR